MSLECKHMDHKDEADGSVTIIIATNTYWTLPICQAVFKVPYM